MGVRVEGIEDAIDLIEEASEGAVAGMVLEITNRVVNRTPVDTGFAQNSWIATFDANDEGTPGQNAPTESAADVAEQYKLGRIVYINNGASYIGVLENGHSNQAPQGFVDITLAEASQILRDELEDELRSRGG